MLKLNFKNIQKYLPKLINSVKQEKELNLSKCEFIDIMLISAIDTLIKLYNPKIIPPTDQNVNMYLSVMNLTNYEKQPYLKNKNNYISIKQFSHKNRTMVTKLSNEIIPQISQFLNIKNEEFKKDFLSYFKYIFGEILNNVVDHSETKKTACICCQAFNDKICLAIADSGIGFKKSLEKNHYELLKLKSDAAINKALEPNITGSEIINYGNTLTYKNAGMGLYVLNMIASHLKAKLVIISKEAIFINNQGKKHSKLLEVEFPGSIVYFEFQENKINFTFEEFMRIYVWKSDYDSGLDDVFD